MLACGRLKTPGLQCAASHWVLPLCKPKGKNLRIRWLGSAALLLVRTPPPYNLDAPPPHLPPRTRKHMRTPPPPPPPRTSPPPPLLQHHAEEHLPWLEERAAQELGATDLEGRACQLRFTFWINATSRGRWVLAAWLFRAVEQTEQGVGQRLGVLAAALRAGQGGTAVRGGGRRPSCPRRVGGSSSRAGHQSH